MFLRVIRYNNDIVIIIVTQIHEFFLTFSILTVSGSIIAVSIVEFGKVFY